MNMDIKVNLSSPEFQSWLEGARRIYIDFMERNFVTNPRDSFSAHQGARYIRIMRGGSVHAFVDRTNGDVLKPASWKAPAKHARGNIFDNNNGLGSMLWTGPAYLR